MKRYYNRPIYIVMSIGLGISMGFYLGNLNSDFAYRGWENCINGNNTINKQPRTCTPTQQQEQILEKLESIEIGIADTNMACQQ